MKKTILKSLLIFGLGFSLVACKSNNEGKAKEIKSIKVGVVGAGTEVWEDVAKRFEEKEGIKIELVSFTDYNQPNDALASGDIALNSFQHKTFLDNYNEEKNTNLVSIGDTLLAPLALYSKNITSLDQLKENDKIAIPDDVTNLSRSLFLLQSAGLIKIDGKPGQAIDLKNITENKLNLEILPLDASQTARSLDDVSLSAINNDISVDAGLIPTRDAIFIEPVDKNSKPYINIVAARKEDKDNEIYKKLVKEYYQTEETAKVLEETSKGSTIPAWK